MLDAADVGALPDTYTPPAAPVQSVNAQTGDVVIDADSLGVPTDAELAAVQASANSKLASVVAGTNITVDDTDPQNPVISASGGGGGGAVDSVNGQTGVVVLDAADVGALPDTYTPPAAPVSSVNGETGAVVLAAADVGAAATTHTHAAADVTSGTFAAARIPNLAISKVTGLQASLDSKVESVTAGEGVSVDATDPNNPIISATGGGGAVDSVNGQTGTVVLDAADVGAATPPQSAVDDSISEWWCQPIATELSQPYPRTVFGGISSTGEILACELNHVTGESKRFVVGSAGVDDHNAPALWIEDGRRPVLMWTNHNDDSLVRLKVGSRDGSLESLTTAYEGTYSINQSASLTSAYTQIFKIDHLSNDRKDTFWVFTRGGGTRWGYTVVEVDQATGQAFAVRPWREVITGGSRQFYITVADAHEGPGKHQVLRFAAGYNPAQPVHDIYYFEIDVVTEIVTSPATPGFSQTISAGPLSGDSMPFDPVVPDPVSDDSRSARLMYVRPGPDAPAVAYATWDRGDEDNATYRVARLTAGQFVANGSYLRTNQASDIGDLSRGFDFSCVFEVPASFPTGGLIGLGGMMRTDSSQSVAGQVFWVRITADGNIGTVGYDSTGTAPVPSVTTTGGPLAADLANPGTALGIRVRYDLDSRMITRYVSRDSDGAWDPLDAGTVMGSEYDALVASGLNPNRHNDNQFRVATGSAAAQNGLLNVFSFSLRDLSGEELAGMDLTRGEYRAGYGSPARMVRDNASLSQIWTDWQVVLLGTSGPRVGYTAAANYIAGAAFEDPSTAEAVYTAHSDAAGESLYRVLLGVPGRPHTSTLIEQFPTADARLTRPYGIRNASGRVGYNFVTEYSPENFREYHADWRVV